MKRSVPSPKIVSVSEIYPEGNTAVFSIMALREIQKFPSTYDCVDSLYPNQNPDFLGGGSFGDAYLLEDNTVVKVTASPAEAYCVQLLFRLQEEKPDEFSLYFPKIYEYGFIQEKYIALEDKELDRLQSTLDINLMITYVELMKGKIKPEDYLNNDMQGYMFPIFWYRREELIDFYEYLDLLNDITDTERMDLASALEDKRLTIVEEIREKFGIELLDALEPDMDNWGVREGTGELVYRDLVCSDDLHKFDDKVQIQT